MKKVFQLFILIDRFSSGIFAKAANLLDGLIVYPENMLKNLNATHGIVFSGQLLLALTQKSVSREDAYV
jgi:adenylosuccinate lyase